MDSGQEDDRGSRGSDESEIRRWRESEGLEPLSFEQLRELKHQGPAVSELVENWLALFDDPCWAALRPSPPGARGSRR